MAVQEVKVGQVWEDNDPRFKATPRRLRVTCFTIGYAHVENVVTGKKSAISLDRFNPSRASGYSLVKPK